MIPVIIEALFDILKILPFLFVIYLLIELFEYKYSKRINEEVKKSGKAGPVIGALAGCLPQCGFSILATALYIEGSITTGTLLAVYISTSDEALPIILATPGKAYLIIPLITTKIILAIAAGYLIDFILKHKKVSHKKHKVIPEGCCDHDFVEGQSLNNWELIRHPLLHTIKLSGYLFLVTVLINYLVTIVGIKNLGSFTGNETIFQPILAALVGLIPNCAASVALAKLYLAKALSFGSVIAGLSASGGLGLLVLFKENKDFKDSLKIIVLLFLISVIAGLILDNRIVL